ncbi:hypothetical protein HPP92_014892 [Vanilla planifolia]|uniref:Uncharacterized protein n=1 Tax=Vanilla planifolia TaxID=51239 RepID=A0A835QKV4_VANPL|nr:hypothetical protein HPP92_015368 [Vanilla planifolia]KAG0475206.1 hypothetical protein HPP92_014892 [Vanilla planifolia]
MDPSFSGFVLDPLKCRKLSIEQKRELIRELVKWPNGALEKLHTWSRRDLLEILCVEMGKERKYTGLTKQKLIDCIFKILSEKKSEEHAEDTGTTPHEPHTNSFPIKRQRKSDHPSRLPFASSKLPVCEVPKGTRFCLNVACRASLSQDDPFCKRCSCCICQKYDENKDPSLWLFCSSEDLSEGDSCGLSCHLDCALKDERTGIAKNGHCSLLDGSYYCVYCGRVNDLLRCWRKQIIIAKDARRVDVLCHRISLSHKLLNATKKYQRLHEIVDKAKGKLEDEVGPLDGIPNMGRGIVNRLSVGAEVQRLCCHAVEQLDFMLSTISANPQYSSSLSSTFIKFEVILSSSFILVLDLDDDSPLSRDLISCTIWHRKVGVADYPAEPTGKLCKPNRRLPITGLSPATEYAIKVVAFSEVRELGSWEVGVTTSVSDKDVIMCLAAEGTSPKTNSSGLSVPASEVDESHNTVSCSDLNKSPRRYFGHVESKKSLDRIFGDKETDPEETPWSSGSALDDDSNPESNTQPRNEIIIAPSPLVTPSGLEAGLATSSSCLLLENGPPKPEREPAGSSKKRSSRSDEIRKQDVAVEGDYEYCVRVVRWLECNGHIESNFRVKFLTWFSLRASAQEKRVVNVFVDTLIDDPGSLAGQLVDTFSDAVCGRRPPTTVPNGFCTRLWH